MGFKVRWACRAASSTGGRRASGSTAGPVRSPGHASAAPERVSSMGVLDYYLVDGKIQLESRWIHGCGELAATLGRAARAARCAGARLPRFPPVAPVAPATPLCLPCARPADPLLEDRRIHQPQSGAERGAAQRAPCSSSSPPSFWGLGRYVSCGPMGNLRCKRCAYHQDVGGRSGALIPAPALEYNNR